jgi:hypothetical protein
MYTVDYLVETRPRARWPYRAPALAGLTPGPWPAYRTPGPVVLDLVAVVPGPRSWTRWPWSARPGPAGPVALGRATWCALSVPGEIIR